MAAAISAFQVAASSSLMETFAQKAKQADTAAAPSGNATDTVSISSQAYAALYQESALARTASGASPQDAGKRNFWEATYGLQAGTTILDNGVSRTVTFVEDEVVIEDFRGDRLIRRERGERSDDAIVRTVEAFDAKGNPAATARTALQGSGAGTGDGGSAMLSRDTTIYENGQVVRTLRENLDVDGSPESLTALDSRKLRQSEGIEDFVRRVSGDAALTRYSAEIKDYSGDNLTGTASVRKSVTETEDALSISMALYDGEGRLSFSAEASNVSVEGKEMRSVGVSWYEQGELVRESHGQFDLQSGEGGGKALTIDQALADYRDRRRELAAADGEKGPPDTGEAEYFLSFEDALYKDGELAYRSLDAQAAAANPDRGMKEFKPGEGLFDSKNPGILRSSKHVKELYEDGKLRARSSIGFDEFVKYDEKNESKLFTRIRGESWDSNAAFNASEDIFKEVEGGLEKLDPKADAAFSGMSQIDGLALDRLKWLFADPGLESGAWERGGAQTAGEELNEI